MQGSLLSHIASNFITEYENVANSSIAYLLNNYSSASEALKIILDIDQVPIYYRTELVTKSNGRPDVTGLDSDGNKSVIIEGKFWANLTDNQPINYLNELSMNGKLLFLAPDKRIDSLNDELYNRIGKSDDRVIVNSWISFIELIEIENREKFSEQLSSDLYQLKELCQKMDTEGLPPLSMSDLDPMNGKISYQFADLIDECNNILRNWNLSNFQGLKTTGSKRDYGFYFKSGALSCRLNFSSYYWYKRRSHTPFWLYLKDKNWNKSERIYHLLNEFDSINSYDDDTSSDYGIMLKPGMDKSQIVLHIVDTVKKVICYINKELE